MKTTTLGQMRITKGRNLDIVLFVPGQGRLLTYSYNSEIAHVHESKYKNQLCNLIYAQKDTEHVVDFARNVKSVSLPGDMKSLNRIVAMYHVDALTMMKIQRMLFLAIVGYENIKIDGSFIARNYTAGKALSSLNSFHEAIDDMEHA